jgi:hypothetical protein
MSDRLASRSADTARLGLGKRRIKEIVDDNRTRRLARERDPGRIAAEGRDVATHPVERRDHVQKTVITRHPALRFTTELGMREKTEGAEAIIERHDDDTSGGKCRAVVNRYRARSGCKTAAMNPHEHRQPARAPRGCPHVQVQTVLADGSAGQELEGPRPEGLCGGLIAVGPKVGGVAYRPPRLRAGGRSPPPHADRRLGERNAQEGIDVSAMHTAHGPVRTHSNDRIGRRASAGGRTACGHASRQCCEQGRRCGNANCASDDHHNLSKPKSLTPKVLSSNSTVA